MRTVLQGCLNRGKKNKKKIQFKIKFTFQIPKYIVKGRDVKVEIDKKHIKVSHRTDSGSWLEVVNDDLPWEINKEESMWTLVPKEHVHVSFLSVEIFTVK